MVQLHAGGVPSLFHGFAFLLQVLALALATAPANAGEYVIERGQDVAVCQAYRDNLNALKPNFAIQCGGRGVRAANPEISFPDWQPIETIEDYPELLPKIWDVLWKRDANPANFYSHLPNKDWHGTKRQKESAYRNYINVQDARGRIFGYSLALVDIDNDGKRETIYLDNPCSHESAILLVLLHFPHPSPLTPWRVKPPA